MQKKNILNLDIIPNTGCNEMNQDYETLRKCFNIGDAYDIDSSSPTDKWLDDNRVILNAFEKAERFKIDFIDLELKEYNSKVNYYKILQYFFDGKIFPYFQRKDTEWPYLLNQELLNTGEIYNKLVPGVINGINGKIPSILVYDCDLNISYGINANPIIRKQINSENNSYLHACLIYPF